MTVARVTAIIPTRNRPQLVLRALASVFEQTYADIEVVVVVDGPDDATRAALAAVGDPRLRVVFNPHSLTAAGARNVGVAHAHSEWIAFLDDDDEWLPGKIEAQLRFAETSGAAFVSCLSEVVTPLATYVWPEAIYDPTTPLDEYLFDRRTTFAGASFIQTSSYFLRRHVYEQCPFRVDNPHDDWDFILRMEKQQQVRVGTVPEALVRLYVEEARPSLSQAGSWRASLAWIDSLRPLLTARAYSGFCLCVVGPRAAAEPDYAAFPILLWRALTRGQPRGFHLAAYLAFWLIPQPLRRQLRAALRGSRRGDDPRVPPGAAAART